MVIHTIEDLQVDPCRLRELFGVLPLPDGILQNTFPRRIFRWISSLVREVHDFVSQDFSVSRKDIQRAEISERSLQHR